MPSLPSMYELLVDDANDAIAALAYSAYKRHETEVMSAILASTGLAPSKSDMDAFYRSASVPASVDMYKEKARALMDVFLDEMLKTREIALERDFASSQIGQQLSIIQDKLSAKKTWSGWAAEVSGNLAVNFVTILVIAALLFGYRGLDEIWSAFGVHVGISTPHR